MSSTFDQFLAHHNACSEAMQWRGDRDLKATWHECKRGDWLIWLLQRLELPDNQLRLIACATVRRTPLGDGRTTWNLLTDDRSRNAVEVAERYANGQATDDELAAARAAAWAAARAAARDAAWDAARDAARAAAWAAAWAAARDAATDAVWDAATDAAWDAARAAAWDAATDAARDAARAEARDAQCAIIREMIPFETVKQLWEERNGQ